MSKPLYPELVSNLKFAERKLSTTLLFLSFHTPAPVAIHVSNALDNVRDALKYLDTNYD